MSEPTDTGREAVQLLALDFDTAAEISCFLSNAKYRQVAATLRALLARAEAAEAERDQWILRSEQNGRAAISWAAQCEEAEISAENLTSERDEAIRRRDAWREKAEGFDAVRLALRGKVGAPWPPNLSRIMWAGIAADEKSRADALQAENARLRETLQSIAINTCCDGCSEAALVARAALEAKP